jgi:hypothetical protein
VVSVICFLSLGLILFCDCIGFLTKSLCAISVPTLGVIQYYLIHNNKVKQTNKEIKGGDKQTRNKTNKQKLQAQDK